MDARFNRVDLVQRIETIGKFKDNISLSNMDAEVYIKNYIPNLPSENTLIYLDPPYFNKSSELYTNSYKEQDHIRLSKVIQNKIKHKWVLSYDGVSEILDLYSEKRHFLYNLQYSAAKNYKGNEIFVFCDDMLIPNSCSLNYINEGLSNLVCF